VKKTTELVIILERNKLDVVNALRIKSLLGSKGIEISGLVVRDKEEGDIPSEFLEEIIKLKIVGVLQKNELT
jgi:hypothetical protein